METISWIIGFISGIVVMASIVITIGILIKNYLLVIGTLPDHNVFSAYLQGLVFYY